MEVLSILKAYVTAYKEQEYDFDGYTTSMGNLISDIESFIYDIADSQEIISVHGEQNISKFLIDELIKEEFKLQKKKRILIETRKKIESKKLKTIKEE